MRVLPFFATIGSRIAKEHSISAEVANVIARFMPGLQKEPATLKFIASKLEKTPGPVGHEFSTYRLVLKKSDFPGGLVGIPAQDRLKKLDNLFEQGMKANPKENGSVLKLMFKDAQSVDSEVVYVLSPKTINHVDSRSLTRGLTTDNSFRDELKELSTGRFEHPNLMGGEIPYITGKDVLVAGRMQSPAFQHNFMPAIFDDYVREQRLTGKSLFHLKNFHSVEGTLFHPEGVFK
jgi:hypothetical protein